LNLLPTVLLDDSNVPEVGCATLDRPNINSTPVGSGRKKKQAAIAQAGANQELRLPAYSMVGFEPAKSLRMGTPNSALQSASPRRNPPRNRL